MTSPALADLWSRTHRLPPRDRVLGFARLMLGTEYDYGDKSAKPIDGIVGTVDKAIDCSGFVRAVFNEAFPEQGLSARDDLNALKLQSIDLFVDVDDPQPADLICWDGHVGIVYDIKKKLFIGAQTSTGVMVAKYGTGYWASTKIVKKFRKWKSL